MFHAAACTNKGIRPRPLCPLLFRLTLLILVVLDYFVVILLKFNCTISFSCRCFLRKKKYKIRLIDILFSYKKQRDFTKGIVQLLWNFKDRIIVKSNVIINHTIQSLNILS